MNIVENFEGWGKFSIFGRNFLVLKVLAHEMSDATQKKIWFFKFRFVLEGGINPIFPGWTS